MMKRDFFMKVANKSLEKDSKNRKRDTTFDAHAFLCNTVIRGTDADVAAGLMPSTQIVNSFTSQSQYIKCIIDLEKRSENETLKVPISKLNCFGWASTSGDKGGRPSPPLPFGNI